MGTELGIVISLRRHEFFNNAANTAQHGVLVDHIATANTASGWNTAVTTTPTLRGQYEISQDPYHQHLLS